MVDSKIPKLDTVMITLVKEDSDGKRYAIRLSGKDARIWAEAVESQSVFCHIHDRPFPKLNWEEV